MALSMGCASVSHEVNVDTDLEYCNTQIMRTLSSLRTDSGTIDYSMIPRNIADSASTWECRNVCPEEWCDGFWPGVLWYNYENTGDTLLRREALRFTESLKSIVYSPVYDHDLGFLIFCSYGNAYRLTADKACKQVILDAADSLATLYNPRVGTLLSWPRNVGMFGGHNTIMDNMINLEMLFWASKNGGRKELYDIAFKHAETTMNNHFRPDGSCYHVAVYDPESGEFIRGCNHQGYDDDSMWARGQAWAIYGYTMVYRETRDPRFLAFAQKVTDVYLSSLPADGIPYWDFRDPGIPEVPRDASAACVVASALIELSDYVDASTSRRYLDASKKMLATLASEHYRCGDAKPAFLSHSVGNMPANSEIDASIIYADYYYIEALTRLRNHQA
ncbi:glycoside hydrolase family 88 protein [uncultured Muribaculum sp.]|uniref:glycoside hydrolase family 88 protein n=1 Tax=uncultured Muribaculum sp. TaxID=1918613 RepID=UPI0025ED434A|nr:glycoside hydrolase family 88 protein [uncultured Muribaculum sp.]